MIKVIQGHSNVEIDSIVSDVSKMDAVKIECGLFSPRPCRIAMDAFRARA